MNLFGKSLSAESGSVAVAILQNLVSGRDPQLAVLYTLIVLTLALMGGGRFSLDAWLENRCKENSLTRV